GGHRSQAQHSTNCWAVHSAVGHGVTAMCRISLLTCRTTKKTYRVWNKIVGTQKKSQAHIFDSCRLRNSRHPGDGPRSLRRLMELATVRAETSNPNLASSAWILF